MTTALPDHPAAKRFKGSLDSIWAAQIAKLTNQNDPKPETEVGLVPPPIQPGREPETPPRQSPPPPGTTPSPPPGTPPPPSGTTPNAGSSNAPPPGEQVLTEKQHYVVVLKHHPPLSDGTATNQVILRVKPNQPMQPLPPKTVLHVISQGVVDETPTNGGTFFQWAFGRLNVNVCFCSDGNGAMQVMSMQEVIQTTKASCIHSHEKFAPGQPPGSLTPKGHKAFVPKGDGDKLATLMKALAGSQKASLMWIVKNSNGKIMPHGIGLVLKKAASVKTGKDFTL